MTTTTGILIDPAALLDVRRELLRHELALTEIVFHLPDTGPTTPLTAGVLARVGLVVGSVADDLHRLADALDRLVDDLADQDGRVSATFDLVRMGTVA